MPTIATREQLHQLVDPVDEDTAEEAPLLGEGRNVVRQAIGAHSSSQGHWGAPGAA
jgi:hypothetical protein